MDVSVAQPKTCHHSTGECVWEALEGEMGRHLAISPRQLSGPIVAQEMARHPDTPKFCVRVIFNIYRDLASEFVSRCKPIFFPVFPFSGPNH